MMRALGVFTAAVQVITVSPEGPVRSVRDGLARAQAGDTVRVRAGVYAERIVIDRPVVLVGDLGAVLDGGGRGSVVTAIAPAVITGFAIRGSGSSQAEEDAGIHAVDADGLVVRGNRLHDVLFGIYVKQSDGVVIQDNAIRGKDIDVPGRGDGIRLWYSDGGRVMGNDLRRVRDVVIWFSNDTRVTDNRVIDSRYGLHYMYSHHNVFERNEFHRNHVGAFLMYSRDVTFRNNIFAAAQGTTGRGLGFKDTDSVLAVGNTLVGNAIGVFIDNSPTTKGVTNEFRDNVIAFNDVGLSTLPSVHSNHFVDNAFVDNVVPARVSGGGTTSRNRFRGNYWSEYAGFDADADGLGDTPFVYERFANDVFDKYPALRIMHVSPAAAALNMLSRTVPLIQATPVVVDSSPRRRWRADAPVPRSGRLGWVFGWLGLTAAVSVASMRLATRTGTWS